MTAQSPQLPVPASISSPCLGSAGLSRTKPRTYRKPKGLAEDDDTLEVANPVKMFDRIVIHPVAWPNEALRWMGVPRHLPTTPPTQPVDLPQGVMSAGLRQIFDYVADTIRQGTTVSREDLSNLVVEAFASTACVQNAFIYTRAKAYLTLGEFRVRVEPMHGFSGSGIAPVLAYVDERFRAAQRAKLFTWRATCMDSGDNRQDDDRVDMMDVVLLLAMAQEHRRWSVPADATGCHTTRVMYPNAKGDALIVLTAVTPAETLAGIQDAADTLKRIKFSRREVRILGRNEEDGWAASPLLQMAWAMVKEGQELAIKAPAPRWPIGPWAWTTHF
ncbi:hypothetical protein GY45DRAFT_1374121 [Cubamyces sp. BRFM 1775]|nr:hypothetical protein GY45DRAFT_1374121 [Cubamyces sp. BRFM 1775]